jgi:hypothetical protein
MKSASMIMKAAFPATTIRCGGDANSTVRPTASVTTIEVGVGTEVGASVCAGAGDGVTTAVGVAQPTRRLIIITEVTNNKVNLERFIFTSTNLFCGLS